MRSALHYQSTLLLQFHFPYSYFLYLLQISISWNTELNKFNKKIVHSLYRHVAARQRPAPARPAVRGTALAHMRPPTQPPAPPWTALERAGLTAVRDHRHRSLHLKQKLLYKMLYRLFIRAYYYRNCENCISTQAGWNLCSLGLLYAEL